MGNSAEPEVAASLLESADAFPCAPSPAAESPRTAREAPWGLSSFDHGDPRVGSAGRGHVTLDFVDKVSARLPALDSHCRHDNVGRWRLSVPLMAAYPSLLAPLRRGFFVDGTAADVLA
jgi:hypothetical protein